ncbi:MAG: Asp-tRNA(Asn)/Glu-tRNA(Gln) amidotransferase subunit GatA [Alphaproteobacteria bacterium]
MEFTIAKTLKALKNKEVSATELTTAYIKKIDDNKDINAYVLTTPEHALAQAKTADDNYANGTQKALEGVPLGIKDIFCTKGIRTTVCSDILSNFVPQYESTITQKLWDNGGVCLGKLNMDEFAMGGSNEKSIFGPVKNPHNLDCVAGGSSGGSAAAVGGDLCVAALGTDTGGSIRQPAAYCGIVGMKPTYGRCSRYGIVAFASSLDQAGPMTKTVEDNAILFNVMAGHDKKDATSIKLDVPDFTQFLNQDVKDLRIGIPKEYKADGMDADVVKAWEKGIDVLKSRGAEIKEISLPHTKYALATYYILAPAEASSNLARFDGLRYGKRVEAEDLDDMYIASRSSGFGAEVKRRIMIGTYVLSSGFYDAYYLKAQKVRQLIKQDFDRAFENVDAILCPTAPTSAFKIGDKSMLENPVNMWLNDIYTVSVNLAGIPAISVPAGFDSKNMPLGLQLIGKSFDEVTLYKLASHLEGDMK